MTYRKIETRADWFQLVGTEIFAGEYGWKAELARELGVSWQTLYRWMNGTQAMSPATLKHLHLWLSSKGRADLFDIYSLTFGLPD